MEILDFVIIGIVGLCVFASVYAIVKRKKNGKCAGCCGGEYGGKDS